MGSLFQWSAGRVLYVYFCGCLLGGWLVLLAGAVTSGGSIRSPLLGVAVALGLIPFAFLRRPTGAKESLAFQR